MRLLWADILKILAIFGVILLHVSAPFVVPFEISRNWWIGNIYDSLTRWCVPLFVMVSGALILGKADGIPLRHFFFVRIRRILLPFIFWSAVYFFYRIHLKADELGTWDFFRMLLTEPIYYHLWFVYMLIVLYLLAPAAGAFLKYAPAKHAWYLMAFWFFWTSLLPIIDKPLPFETYFTPDMNDYSALRLSGYFLLGYMLKERFARSGLELSLVLITFMAGGAATILGTYWLSLGRGEFHPFFYKYFSITVVAMAVSLFVFVKSIFNTRSTIADGNGKERILMNSPRILQQIGMSVFGVYLVHALVLELLRDGRFGFVIDHTSAFGIQWSPAVGLPFFAMAIFVFSIAPIMIVRLIPILRELVT
jgi:surface polysaccharide O-acyltransferase-like enzyme